MPQIRIVPISRCRRNRQEQRSILGGIGVAKIEALSYPWLPRPLKPSQLGSAPMIASLTNADAVHGYSSKTDRFAKRGHVRKKTCNTKEDDSLDIQTSQNLHRANPREANSKTANVDAMPTLQPFLQQRAWDAIQLKIRRNQKQLQDKNPQLGKRF
jgi:hypothetical protein